MNRCSRPRLIGRDDRAFARFPAANLMYGTLGFTDPVNSVTSATPIQGVQNPHGTAYRSINSV